MAICQLCKKSRKLCDSHIVPEFLYKELYDNNHKFMGISGRGNKGWKPLQKGVREKLLCDNCEQFLNEKYEKPFHNEWVISSSLPDRIIKDTGYTASYNYTYFKLFHLSILFRASVCSLPTFRHVTLAAHENRIRNMLLTENPGNVDQYPILAFAVLNSKGNLERRMISNPLITRWNGHLVYAQIYGGAMWWISVSSHRNNDFCKVGLKSSGKLTFLAIPWNEIALMRDVKVVLSKTNL